MILFEFEDFSIAEIAKNNDNIDFICVGGDIINGYETCEGAREKAAGQITRQLDVLKKSGKDVIVLMGNHDDNSYHLLDGSNKDKELYEERIITDLDWQNYIINRYTNKGNIEVVQDDPAKRANSKYFYYDLEGKKTRVICLDSLDYEAKYDENGNLTESDTRTGLWAWKHPHKADGTITYKLLEGEIRMFDVDFGYYEEKIVLHDVTLYAEPGQKVAFVGATGAGKTTITNLINRFYDIADGKIRYDGININKIKKPDLRRSLGIVLQDTNLFTGTVRDNIRYGKLDATDEEIIRAAHIANAYDFIMRLPNGFDTMLESDGANLSQGQRQLISIARAAVADAPVMILDEATSSIDTRTELKIQNAFASLMKGRTSFIVAHRLSTIRDCDEIVVLDRGNVVERGTHDELLAKNGAYARLYNKKF